MYKIFNFSSDRFSISALNLDFVILVSFMSSKSNKSDTGQFKKEAIFEIVLGEGKLLPSSIKDICLCVIDDLKLLILIQRLVKITCL